MMFDPAYWMFFMACALLSALVGYGAGVAQERIDRAAKFRAIADEIAERRRQNMRRHSSPQVPKFLTRGDASVRYDHASNSVYGTYKP